MNNLVFGSIERHPRNHDGDVLTDTSQLAFLGFGVEPSPPGT